MRREEMLREIVSPGRPWDIIVIGGGATGTGVAVEAASRGYRTVLLERNDFGTGTSSRSTKLVHGGVRYLQQGNVALVLEALRERAILRKNAPHLVHDLPFVVPVYDWWEGPFYGIGLKVYDALAGKHGFGPSRNLSREETLALIPTVEPEGLRGGVIYHDGQFDDARMVINLVRTAAEQGATVLNYMPVTALIHEGGLIQGVRAVDLESGSDFELLARSVINATGVFSDTIRRMDDASAPSLIRASQGVHLTIDRTFLPGESAIMVPHTDDGRVLFAVPWLGHVILGTTDTPVDQISAEPRPLDEEIDFLLEHAGRYLTRDPGREDVLSAFAGLRPLVQEVPDGNTAAISREHTIHVAGSGLITIAGGKWTTYRKMAEETIDSAILLAELDPAPSVSEDLQIHGYHRNAERFGDLRQYGSDAPLIEDIRRGDPALADPVDPDHPVTAAEVVWAARQEMARTVEDVLARRSRMLQLDARATIRSAPRVAQLLAAELGREPVWQTEQIEAFTRLATGYLPA